MAGLDEEDDAVLCSIVGSACIKDISWFRVCRSVRVQSHNTLQQLSELAHLNGRYVRPALTKPA